MLGILQRGVPSITIGIGSECILELRLNNITRDLETLGGKRSEFYITRLLLGEFVSSLSRCAGLIQMGELQTFLT